MADRLAADFHLSPSNMLVAPLDAAGIYPRCDLVVYRARARTELFGAYTPFALAAEQHDLVPQRDLAVDAEDAGVHRNPSQERAPEAPDQGLGPPRQGSPVPFGVTDGHGRREHRLPGPEGQPVRHPVPRSDPPHIGYVALQRHRGPQVLRGRVSFVACRV